jgi:DNA primase
MAIRVAAVPPPHDPDSFIKEHGAEAFQGLITKAEGFFDFYLKRLCALNDPASDKGRLAILNDMGAALKKTGNTVLLDTYAQKTALRLQVNPNSVLQEFRKQAPRRPVGGEADDGPPEEAPAARPPPPELRLLHLALSQDDLYAWLAPRLDLNWLQHDAVRRIFGLRLAAHNSQNWPGLGPFLMEIEEESLRSLITEALADAMPAPSPEKESRDILLQLRNAYVDRCQAELVRRMAATDLSPDEDKSLMGQHLELGRLKRAPLE